MPAQEKPQNGYVGVNLRVDPANVADDKHAVRAVNVDFNKELGTASIRNGSYELADLNDDVVRLIAKVNGFRYYVAGRRLYRDGVLVDLTPQMFDAGLNTDIEGFRPLNDLAVWAFIADVGNSENINAGITVVAHDGVRTSTTDGRGHSAMKKDDGTRTQKWGIGEPPGPLATPISNIGDGDTETQGAYTWNVTYVRFDTTNLDNPAAVAHEGNPIEVSITISPPPPA